MGNLSFNLQLPLQTNLILEINFSIFFNWNERLPLYHTQFNDFLLSYLQNTISSTPPSPPVSLAMAVTSTIPPGQRSSSPCSAASGPPNRCCDSGRPLFTDPSTGQTVCSCQHEQMLSYQRLAQASLMGHGGMQLSMYNSAYADGLPTAAYLPGADQSHFYPNLVSIFVFNTLLQLVETFYNILLWYICES